MNHSCPGAQYANGVTRAIMEPSQPAPINNGVGDQNRLADVTLLAQSVAGAHGVRKNTPADSGIPTGKDPI